MLSASILTVILAGLLISHAIHRTTLAGKPYSEAKKLRVSAGAYLSFLLAAAIGYIPLILLMLVNPSISVELVCLYGIVLDLSLIALAAIAFHRLRMTEDYRYWHLGRSLVTLATTATVALTISVSLVGYRANKLVSQIGIVTIVAPQGTQAPVRPTSGATTATAEGTGGLGWIEAHPSFTRLAGPVCGALITAVAAIWVAIIAKSGRK